MGASRMHKEGLPFVCKDADESCLFWARLQDFVTLHAACEPKRWAGAALTAEPSLSAATGHPFMQIHPAGPTGQLRRLVLLVPGQQPPGSPGAAAAAVGGGGDDAG